MEQYFRGIAKDKQDKILNTPLLIYVCEGTESEIKEWFKTINIAGVPLNHQEVLNAIYSGTFVTLENEKSKYFEVVGINDKNYKRRI